MTLKQTLSLSICLASAFAASWTAATPYPEGVQGGSTFVLMTDGTILMPDNAGPNWYKLTPDAHGNYATGTWSAVAPMSQAREFFASQILPSGKLFVLGGEYGGPGGLAGNIATSEIYDPLANTWTTAARYPDQPDCGTGTIPYNGNTTSGSAVITGIPSTLDLYVGWSVSGTGIPSGATIVSLDSATQVTISSAATATASGVLTFSGNVPACFGATESILLPGGTQILAGNLLDRTSFLYNIATNTWSPTGSKFYNDPSDEEGWAMTGAPGKVIVYDISYSTAQNAINHLNQGYAEKYDPATGTWTGISPADGTALGTLPVLSSAKLGNEFGPTLRLQDGRILEIGGNNLTALYTPSTNTWAAGPTIVGTLNGQPAPFGADDAAGAILPNGHVIFAADAGPATTDDDSFGTTTEGSNVMTGIPSTAIFQVGWGVADADGTNTIIPTQTTIVSIDGPHQITMSNSALVTSVNAAIQFGGTFSSPTQLFDFNPAGAGSIAPLAAVYPGDLTQVGAYLTRMLVLPTGQIFFGLNQNTQRPYIYTPDGSASPALRPVITNITYNGSGKFTLTGRQLDGQSAGASYGDDAQMDSNYPILRLVNSTGNVYYCRSTNWYAGVVAGGTAVTHTVNFTLNAAMPAGNYSAIVSGAGISSFPIALNITQGEINGQ
jgi:hypothetical protein